MVCALLGLAPWLVTGMNLPLQNVWREEVLPEAMPLALLPLSQYYLVAAAAMVVVGSALGGAAARLAARRGRPLRAWLVGAGAAVVQFVAVAQASWVLNNGLEESTRSRAYILGMLAAIAVAIIVGLFVTVTIGNGGVAATTIAIAIAALAFSEWLPTVLFPIGNAAQWDLPRVVSTVVLWMPTVIVGLAAGWCGVASARRALATVVSLLTFWVGSAAITGLSVAIGSRVLLQNPSELLPAATDTFREGLTSSALSRQLLLAVVIAIIVAATAHALRRIDRAGEEPTA